MERWDTREIVREVKDVEGGERQGREDGDDGDDESSPDDDESPVITLIERNPPPRWVSYLLCSLIKNRV